MKYVLPFSIEKKAVLLLFLSMALCSFSQDSLKTVVAVKGDGIYSLLRKQGMNPSKYYKDFIDLNKKWIKDSTTLVAGRSYKIPLIALDTVTSIVAIDSTVVREPPKKPIKENSLKTETYPIFGEAYEEVPLKSKRLKDAVYYLISGHGGPDPGAVEKYGGRTIAEDEYAYDVTLRLARELLSHSAKVYIIIRDPDDGIRDGRLLEIDRDELSYPKEKIPLNQTRRLKQRVVAVNKLYVDHVGKYQRLIVTHVDSRSKGQNIDVFFYHHEKSKNGKRLAENIHTTFQKKYKKYQPNRKYTGTFSDRSSLYLVKKTLPPMVYIEIGNIKNPKDQRRILDPDNRQALAKWISEGVLLDFEE